jgi:outer membrane protein TolC
MFLRALSLLLLAGLLISVRADAQAPSSSEPDTSLMAGEVEGPMLAMTLDDAQRLAVANSPVTRGALAGLRAARGARMRESGAFDPVLTAADQQVSTDSPVSSPFAGSELRQRLVSGGVSWLSPIGTALNVSLVQNKTETNAPFTTLPRERRTGARIDFVQPLLKGFGLAATRGELRAVSRELDAARRRYEGAVLRLGSDVETAYWVLYAVERDIQARRLQRQRAALFLRDQVLRGRAGIVGPGAVAAARTLLAEQEANLLDARLALQTSSDQLAQAIGISPGTRGRLHASDEPPPLPALEPLGVVMTRALAVNTDLRAAEQDTAAALARMRRAAWNAWPSLDAFGGYGGSGLAGTSRQIVFGGDTVGTVADSDFGTAWDQVWGDDFPDWNFGLRLTMPIPWRADRGEAERRRAEYQRSRESLRARRLQVETDVRAAYRETETAQATLRAMGELVAATQEQSRIVRLEYQAGRATAYDLVDVETQLAQATLRESQALVRVARSQTELRRLTQPAPQRAP